MIEKILTDLKIEIESIEQIEQQYIVSKGTNNGFEKLVPIVLEQVIDKYSDKHKIILKSHYGHHFPDLDITIDENKYGIEIKFRKNGTWTTNGNSVFESITDENYENIYLLFGSKTPKKNQVKVKFAPYWRAAKSIKVTHSPRFYINMNDLDSSVFESESEYNYLRKMDDDSKVAFIQKYLSESTKGAKWYSSDKEDIKAVPFNNLPKETQKQIIIEIMLLYPEDLLNGNRNTKYDRAAQYMIDEYYAYSKSLRDSFSASGQEEINGILFPRIIKNFIDNSNQLLFTLNDSSEDFKKDALEGWLSRNLINSKEKNIEDTYKLVINNIATKDKKLLSKIYELGFDDLSSFIFS